MGLVFKIKKYCTLFYRIMGEKNYFFGSRHPGCLVLPLNLWNDGFIYTKILCPLCPNTVLRGKPSPHGKVGQGSKRPLNSLSAAARPPLTPPRKGKGFVKKKSVLRFCLPYHKIRGRTCLVLPLNLWNCGFIYTKILCPLCPNTVLRGKPSPHWRIRENLKGQ